MSENKEPEIREQNNGSEHEPIESIEQTVADLKKKIEELTEEQRNRRSTRLQRIRSRHSCRKSMDTRLNRSI